MKIIILTLFPEMFDGPFSTSILKSAQERDLVEITICNLRDYALDTHKSVDDRPYGGGIGMVIKVDVVDRALKTLKKKSPKAKVYVLSPQGRIFNQKKAREMVKEKDIILLAGHYEGFDERIIQNLVDEEISIGNYVLTGGELPAMVIVDSITRLIPGVLDEEATKNESFSNGNVLDFPQYTRPEIYKNWKVPEILLHGDHRKINAWRKEEALKKTLNQQKQDND